MNQNVQSDEKGPSIRVSDTRSMAVAWANARQAYDSVVARLREAEAEVVQLRGELALRHEPPREMDASRVSQLLADLNQMSSSVGHLMESNRYLRFLASFYRDENCKLRESLFAQSKSSVAPPLMPQQMVSNANFGTYPCQTGPPKFNSGV